MTLGSHLCDEPCNFDLGDVLLLGDDVEKFSSGGQLGDEGHAVLVVVDLNEPGQPRVVQDVHHLELVHHPDGDQSKRFSAEYLFT